MSPLHTALIETLGCHFVLSKKSLATVAALMLGFVQLRTVNLSHWPSMWRARLVLHQSIGACSGFFQFIRSTERGSMACRAYAQPDPSEGPGARPYQLDICCA